jgi:hypothetical protein
MIDTVLDVNMFLKVGAVRPCGAIFFGGMIGLSFRYP